MSSEFGPPFDHDDADIILRSSDQVDFYVYQAILSASSPFFKSMLSLPQPNSGASENKIPFVDLPENSWTIATILECIYPIVSEALEPEPFDLDKMMDALVAAKKYDMAIVSHVINQKFASSTFAPDDPMPMMVFCAAYSRELGETCRIAANLSLKCRMNLDNIVDKLPCMAGPAFHQLYKFHRACSATAAEAVSDTHLGSWITKLGVTWWKVTNRECSGSGLGSGTQCRTFKYVLASPRPDSRSGSDTNRFTWFASIPFRNFITRAHDVLLEQPCQEAVTNDQFLAPSYEAEGCNRCQLTFLRLPEFIRLMREEIDRRISEVRHRSFTQHIVMISSEG